MLILYCNKSWWIKQVPTTIQPPSTSETFNQFYPKEIKWNSQKLIRV